MATPEQMAAFEADQQNIPCSNVPAAAALAIDLFDLDDIDRAYLQRLADAAPHANDWANIMTRDIKGRFVWIHGGMENAVVTYRKSQWPDGPPSKSRITPDLAA